MSYNNLPLTKADFDAGMNALETRLKEYIDERVRDVETRLLRLFSDNQSAQTTRFWHIKADLGNVNTFSDERLAAPEQRTWNVEKRLIEKHT